MHSGKLTQIKNLTCLNGVDLIDNNNEILYNIMLQSHTVMSVNNMIINTLHPDDLIAQVYRETEDMNKEDKKFIFRINYFINYFVLVISLTRLSGHNNLYHYIHLDDYPR